MPEFVADGVGAREVTGGAGIVSFPDQRVDLVIVVADREDLETEHRRQFTNRLQQRRSPFDLARVDRPVRVTGRLEDHRECVRSVEVFVHRAAEFVDGRCITRRVESDTGDLRPAHERVQTLDGLLRCGQLRTTEVGGAAVVRLQHRQADRASVVPASASATVVKLPSDFDILSPPIVTMP